MLDLIIVGAGPAGLSACLYASRAGLDVLILDMAAPGGKLNVTAQIENYPGVKPSPGPEIAYQMYESALSFGAKMDYQEVVEIKDCGDFKEVVTAKQTYQTKYVLIATGTKERQMHLPKENELVEILTQKYPNVTVIYGHMGGYHWMDVVDFAKTVPNAYIDLSAAFSTLAVRMAITELPDKCIFSSDAPYGEPLLSKQLIEFVSPSKEITDKILGENILKILK